MQLSPEFLLEHPEMVSASAPWCVVLDNLELGTLLLAQPWLAGDGLRRADLERQLTRLATELPLGPVYFQRVNRAVARLEAIGAVAGVGSGHSRRFLATPPGFRPSYSDDFPDVSPGADRIVFSSFREQAGQNLYIMDLAGANVQQVTTGGGQRIYPRWAPNDLIAFVYPAYSQNAQIWTVKSDGTGLHQVTSPTAMESDGAGNDFYAAGQQIVFSRYDRTAQRYDLYPTTADGSGGAQRITQTADISETLPAVSHDGRLLACPAFYHSRHGMPSGLSRWEASTVARQASWRGPYGGPRGRHTVVRRRSVLFL